MILWDSKHEADDSDDDEEMADEEHGEEEQDELEEHKSQSNGSEGSEEGDSENNSCIAIYFQSAFTGLEELCILQILEAILEEEFFDELRTK